MKLILVAGQPGTGKSTLMKMIFPDQGREFRYKTVRGELFGDVARIGIYKNGERYPGTDRLSMAVQPDFLDFVEIEAQRRQLRAIVAEGDRLSNVSAIKALRTLPVELHVIVLQTSDRILEKRRIERKDTFSDVWLRARVTKVENFRRAALEANVLKLLPSNSLADQIANAERLSALIYG